MGTACAQNMYTTAFQVSSYTYVSLKTSVNFQAMVLEYLQFLGSNVDHVKDITPTERGTR